MFSPRDERRIANVVRRVEAEGRGDPQRTPRGAVQTPEVRFCDVTSTTVDGNGRYPAQLQSYDADTDAWSNVTDCRVESLSGTLAEGRIACVRVGDDGTYPVFSAVVGFGADSAIGTGPMTPVFSGAKVYPTSARLTNAGDTDIITFDSAEFDTDTYFDGTNKLTAPVTGYYRVSFRIAVELQGSSTDGSVIDAAVRKNGSSTLCFETKTDGETNGTDVIDLEGDAVVHLASSDYVQLQLSMFGSTWDGDVQPDPDETNLTIELLSGSAGTAGPAGPAGADGDNVITVRKNSGSDVGTRGRLNLIEGSNVTLTVADDSGSGEVDITIASSAGSSYTDEDAQDAVGAMIADTDTVTLTYTDATPELKADVRTQLSITSDSAGIMLVNDLSSPGTDRVYGTNALGVKTWRSYASFGGGWVKYTVSYTDMSAAATNKTVLLVNLAASADIEAVVVRANTVFAGTTTLVADVSVGGNNVITSHDLMAAVSGTNFAATYRDDSPYLKVWDFGATTAINLVVTSTGANLSSLTQGSVDVWLKMATLP